MTARDAFRAFVAPRTTLLILGLVAGLLLLLVVVPQERTLGPDPFARIALASRWNRLLLVELGLGRLPTSPVFLGVLALFFANLAAVIAARAGPTWRRIAPRQLNERGLAAWARLEESLAAPLPGGWQPTHPGEILRGFGYRVRRPGERTFWGVKHAAAPVGFLLFHLSFFLVSGGSALLYYTRFQGTAVLTEGQEFEGKYTSIERLPPVGGPPKLRFVVEEVEARRESGEPVHLSARLRFPLPGSAGEEQRARVNHPARLGSTTLLVTEASLSPVLWLQDSQGFTLDRVAVPVKATPGDSEPVEVPLAAGRFRARIHPLGPDEPFPERRSLAATALRIELLAAGVGAAPLFDGRLRPGESVEVPGLRLVLPELRYWVSVQVVAERGGSLLMAGFLIGIVGVAWRLLLYRREVALTWDERELRLVGRAEYYSQSFRQELAALRDTLTTAPPTAPRGMKEP